MRDEAERRKAKTEEREQFRAVLATMDEAQLLALEALFVQQVDTINGLIKRGEDEVEHKIELLSDIDDRLLYLENISFKNIVRNNEK